MPRATTRATAERLRQQAATDGWSPWQLAEQVAAACETSLLQSHRLARGWTLEVAVTSYAVLRGRLTVQQLSSWERGTARPGQAHLDGLCQLYETRPDRLGFGRDYTPRQQAAEPARTVPVPVAERAAEQSETGRIERQRILRGLLVGAGVTLSMPILTALAGVRQSMADTLSETLSETTMEQWERSAAEYGHAYQMRPPSELLAESVLDFAEVQQLLARRQAADYRLRLCHVAAHLAGTAGMALVALGEQREARSWFRCAQLAAEETNDRTLRAWLLAREAVIPFYYGSPRAAAELAERARLVAGNAACATSAWAPSLEARALARLGRADDAQAAMRLAEQAFERLPDNQVSDTAYGYTERQLRWHIGSMYTVLGDSRRAQASLDQALMMYAPSEHLDRALIALDQAAGLINVGEIPMAAQVAVQTLELLPGEHRTGIVVARAREIVATVPVRAARGAAVRELTEAVR